MKQKYVILDPKKWLLKKFMTAKLTYGESDSNDIKRC
jgi:hypothetical protein